MSTYDVIVVGAGNAALAAAVSAKENGAERVVVVEKAPREMRGGNTHWSGGVFWVFCNDLTWSVGMFPRLAQTHSKFYNQGFRYFSDAFYAVTTIGYIA